MKQVIDFLSALKQNNNRDWFQENKKQYEEAKQSVLEFVGRLIPQIKKFDDSIGDIQPKDTLFRIFRDIRFSKDKSPYKTNMGAFMANGGRKSTLAGYYIHLEPGKSFLGGGSYCPAKEELQKIRNEIYYHPEDFKSILADTHFKKYFKELWNDKLSRPPKGFDKDFADIELLKYKSYVNAHELDDKMVISESFLDYCVDVFRAMYDFNHFLNKAISG